MMNMGKGIGLGFDVSLVNQNRVRDSKYIDPDVLESLVGVWIADQNTNDSPTRNIIKNKLSNRGGDLEISNAAYKGMSGYNGYPAVFGNNETYKNLGTIHTLTATHNKINITKAIRGNAFLYSWIKSNGNIIDGNNKVYPEFKVKVSNLPDDCTLNYYYLENNASNISIVYLHNGINNVPKSEIATDALTVASIWIGFIINPPTNNYECDITIEVLPEYKDAFVTDGVDDLIVSQKNISEMLNGSSEVTVISMIGSIKGYNNSETGYTNVIKTIGEVGVVRNEVKNANSNKLGIYGYSQNINSISTTVNNTILGDKNDYSTAINRTNFNVNCQFSVVGYIEPLSLLSQVAYYWTIMANKVLTEDQINQVIAYFNLDKYVEPIVYYDVKKQGITNENHTQFNDKLIDYSGNGRDLQLYNFGWKLDSGVGKYNVNFLEWNRDTGTSIDKDSSKFTITGELSRVWVLWNTIAVPGFKVKVSGINKKGHIYYLYSSNDNNQNFFRIYEDGIYTIPENIANKDGRGFIVSDHTLDWTGLTIEQIPEYEGALVSDGVDDYGHFVGDLGLKDYTVAMNRTFIKDKILAQTNFLLKTGYESYTNTPILFESTKSVDAIKYISSTWSFGYGNNILIPFNEDNIKWSYQSTYVYNDTNITKGSGTGIGNGIILNSEYTAKNFTASVVKQILLFPYSLSKFLLERQLKKRKIGTLYPDMVEFRPVVKSNVPYNRIQIYDATNIDSLSLIYDGTTVDKTGTYYPKGTAISIFIRPDLTGSNEVSSITVNGKKYYYVSTNPSGFYIFNYVLDKPIQKIDITIDEYIRFEDIAQPYPAFVTFRNIKPDGSTYTYYWGSKLKLGDLYIVNYRNLYYPNPGYHFEDVEVNGLSVTALGDEPIVMTKDITLSIIGKKWIGNNEPTCIFSLSKLRLPNSSYKILGYIPDISGHGNHGYLYNSAYADGSGVNADGSYQLDGIDDYITFKALNGGKQMIMKTYIDVTQMGCAYDQRANVETDDTFCVFVYSDIAYTSGNNGKTYLDGILNSTIKGLDLVKKTHNITITNENVTNGNSTIPFIGKGVVDSILYAKMSLYDFMLFPEISTDDEIMKLNERIGIEGNVDMSGQGVGRGEIAMKPMNFTEWDARNESLTITPTSFRITSAVSWTYVILTRCNSSNEEYYVESTKIRVTGVSKGRGLAYSHQTGNTSDTFANYWIEVDGEHTLPQSYVGKGLNSGFKTQGFSGECDILVEIIQ